MPLWVYTRALKTKRINAVPGLPLESRLNSPYGRKFLKETFGDDIIVEVDTREPENFLRLVAEDGDDQVRDKFEKLKALVDEQAKTIKSLEKETDVLKRQLKRRGAEGQASAN